MKLPIMRKILKCFKCALLLVMMSECANRNTYEKTGLEGKALPEFSMQLMDSVTNFNTKSVSYDKPVVIFLFSPYCPFCKAQTKDMIENMTSIKNIHFFMLSSYPFHAIKKFYMDYHLDKYSNITVGRDTALFFSNYIKAIGIPYLAIYGKDNHLKQGLLGRVSTDKIKHIAFE